ncbi:hypothetical protein [Streptomyces sp. NPDC001678]|uniref:hypothetical protein n=1 Tax=Streptomyces sp. NPDC001678 TaxID=3364599 RepID=UPI0036B5AADF
MPSQQERAGRLQRTAPPAPIKNAVTVMYAGVALTLVAVLAVIIDQATADSLTQGLKDAYPQYSSDRIDTVKSSILTYLFTIGVAGVCLWLWLARASRKGKSWSRVAATVVFALATFISLYNFTQHFPLYVTVAGLLPCAAGLVAVGLLWKRDASSHFAGDGATA